MQIPVEKYIWAFGSLNVNKRGDRISPHKPILLLAVMELVEKGEIVSPFIPFSKELEETFKRIWYQNVPDGSGCNCTIHNPLFHMQSEGFWRLERLPWYVEKTSYSLKDLRRNFYGAIINEDLFMAFCDRSQREKLRKVLFESYLAKINIDTSLGKSVSRKGKITARGNKVRNKVELWSKVVSDMNIDLAAEPVEAFPIIRPVKA